MNFQGSTGVDCSLNIIKNVNSKIILRSKLLDRQGFKDLETAYYTSLERIESILIFKEKISFETLTKLNNIALVLSNIIIEIRRNSNDSFYLD